MKYHIKTTFNREVKSKNIKQLRNISKHHAKNYGGQATVVKLSPRQAVVKVDVNRNQARAIAKRLKTARGYKRLQIERA